MPIKKSNKIATSVCPHTDCQVSFMKPISEKGILFCPHCERSLLMVEPVSLEEMNQKSTTTYKKKKSLSYNFFRIAPFLMGILTAFLFKKYIGVNFLENFWFISLVVLLIVFELYKTYINRLSYRLKNKKITFIAGIDSLADIHKFTEVEADYVNNKGALTQAPCYLNKTELPELKTCPHCTSQLVVKLPQVVGWRKDLYSQYDIFRPSGIPSSGYCAATDRYVDSDPTL